MPEKKSEIPEYPLSDLIIKTAQEDFVYLANCNSDVFYTDGGDVDDKASKQLNGLVTKIGKSTKELRSYVCFILGFIMGNKKTKIAMKMAETFGNIENKA